jgi:hypothetical protein
MKVDELKDFFAGQALAGLVARAVDGYSKENYRAWSRTAYEIAEAMLNERTEQTAQYLSKYPEPIQTRATWLVESLGPGPRATWTLAARVAELELERAQRREGCGHD